MEKRKYKRLHYEDRQTIEAMSKQGSSVKDIAEALGTHRDALYVFTYIAMVYAVYSQL